jgi:predicted RNA-binding protein with PUA-like domain
MATFIFKTEPGEYSFEDLLRDERTVWSGVSNAQALGYLRAAAPGDEVLIYETGSRKAIVGMAEVASAVYEDPERPGLTAGGDPKFPVVEIVPVKRASQAVRLEEIRQDARFIDLPLVRQPRLSVMLVPGEIAVALKQLTGLSQGQKGRGLRGVRKRI